MVEIGAGAGLWAETLKAIAYDLAPRAEWVRQGDHTDAAKHPGLMLAVWPPDGTAVQAWIEAAPWPVVAIVGSFPRLEFGQSLDAYRLDASMALPNGCKGGNRLRVYTRRADVVYGCAHA